ncbi:hypothetical protein E0485_10415 [Paenibacillus albiflavus]|uniref:Sigma factor regulator C-terminal domain-containing protein n=1 Tax=Paenibacillus albiflavus TaxID=2545760 RepID=A0A4R4EDX2_9BACL|nr:anti sigma factor C-terminal domain-containing protein [Paenibacillus albiflavus]TCZ77403.1 hypothetical protein E0485_10415 [Paenibacillus albiflavus]
MIPENPISEPIPTSRKQIHSSNRRIRIGFSRVVVIAILLLILYGASYILLSIYNEQSGRNNEFTRYGTTLIELHNGIRVDNIVKQQTELTALLSQQATFPIYENVGSWQVAAGEATVTKNLLGKYEVSIHLDTKYIRNNNQFKYSLPYNLMYGSDSTPVMPSDSQNVWDQIKSIEDGHVATMAFSLTKGIEPEVFQARLRKYDIHLLSMPIYSGELKDIKDGLSVSSSGSSISTNTLTLRPANKYTEQGLNRLEQMNDPQAIQDSAAQTLIDLEWLINHGSYDEQELDKLRLQYLKTHGVKIYGAVVTGPIRELEKLKEGSDLFDFQLGNIEIWNWRQ